MRTSGIRDLPLITVRYCGVVCFESVGIFWRWEVTDQRALQELIQVVILMVHGHERDANM